MAASAMGRSLAAGGTSVLCLSYLMLLGKKRVMMAGESAGPAICACYMGLFIDLN